MSVRLTLALETGLALPEDGAIAVFGPVPDSDLSALPKDRVEVIQTFRPHHDHFAQAGFRAVTQAAGPYAAAIVILPRAKPLAQAMIWQALSHCAGPVVVDGQKTDGVDSIIKALRKRADLSAPVNKAHGKLVWFEGAAADFADWAPAETQLPSGQVTAPGCFSADGIDPASAMLAEALPEKLGKHVVDLGGGWGYLSAQVLARQGVARLDLVEAEHIALDCARRNIADDRMGFHWADALNWKTDHAPDTIVMNPPFHTGRAADPALGRAFVEAAARLLASHGTLWMVANRHLPYEATLTARFRDWGEIAGDNRFKILRAVRPARSKR